MANEEGEINVFAYLLREAEKGKRALLERYATILPVPDGVEAKPIDAEAYILAIQELLKDLTNGLNKGTIPVEHNGYMDKIIREAKEIDGIFERMAGERLEKDQIEKRKRYSPKAFGEKPSTQINNQQPTITP